MNFLLPEVLILFGFFEKKCRKAESKNSINRIASSNKINTIKSNLNTKKEKKNPMNKFGMTDASSGCSVKLLYKKYNPT